MLILMFIQTKKTLLLVLLSARHSAESGDTEMRDLVPAAECGRGDPHVNSKKTVHRRRICNVAGGWCPGTASCTGMEPQWET